jgi:HK97 family phage portal protein
MVRLSNPFAGAGADPDQAMRLSAVFACLRLLSEAVATMPLDTFVRSDGARLPYRPKPDYLSFQPPQNSRIDYLSQVMLSLLTNGNAFVATPRDDLGVPLDLVPIDPTRVTVRRDDQGRITYRVGNTDYDAFDVMHIKGMCLPGALRGLSPLGYAAETVDLGLSAQRYGAAFFANGAVPGAVIEAPNDFSQPAAERFQAMWNSRHQGVSNAARVGVLVNGARLNKVSINPDEAQFLETRQFQVPDVARIFGVPPHLIADASTSTSWGSGLAEQNLAFGQFSLRPWVDRIEDAHGRLLTTHGLPQVFEKLNMDALLRAATKERYDAHAVGLASGFLTVNEVRRLEDLPPITPPPAPPPPPVPPKENP